MQLARGSEEREKGVPATVVAPPPEPADFDGHKAAIGKMPPTGIMQSQVKPAACAWRCPACFLPQGIVSVFDAPPSLVRAGFCGLGGFL